MSESNVPDPFESAERLGGVNVRLGPEDVLNEQPDVAYDTAERLLERHGGIVAGAMIRAGIEAAIALLRRRERGAP